MAGANVAKMHVNGHEVLPVLLKDIADAQRTVHVSMFLFFNDPVGEEVSQALIAKARAGVTVRVLLNVEKTAMGDPFSTGEKEMMKKVPSWPHDPMDAKPLCEAMKAAGVQVLDTNIDYDHTPKHADERLRSIAAQIREGIAVDDLHIDHRKVVVIDGRIGWCGGANIGAQYLYHHPFDPAQDAQEEAKALVAAGKPEAWWKWHDSLTRFEGEIAHDLETAFRDRWVLDEGEYFEPAPAQPPGANAIGFPVHHAELLTNEPSKAPNQVCEAYQQLIREAEHEIFIENPYFYEPKIVDALCEAKKARPNLRVTIMVPERKHNDNLFSQDAQEYLYATWLKCGFEVYEYLNHFSHLKLAVFDARRSFHGSTNLNYRSLEVDKDFELVVLVDDEAFARDVLARTRDVDITHARRITEADLRGSFMAFRRKIRDPRTLLLLWRRML